MLTMDNRQGDLLEGWISPALLELSEELTHVDRVLDGEGILKPFLAGAKLTGRPTTAMATYVRMMYLKFRYQMSYAACVQEVSDSLKWRKFCHLPITGKVPDDKTLIKLTGRYGEKAVRELFEAVVAGAVREKVIRGGKMRLDTTVTESNMHYPTDTGLLSDGVRVITRVVKRIKKVVTLKVQFRNRRRAMKRGMMKMLKFLKGKKAETKGLLKKAKEELLALGKKVYEEGQGVVAELAGAAGAVGAGAGALVLSSEMALKHWLELMKRVIDQTEMVLSGNVHIPNRLVSLFDEGARPIQKGKLFPGTEFGRKVLVQEAEKGVVTDYQVLGGVPTDAPLLEGAIERHVAIFGKAPRELAGDRGFHNTGQDEGLHERGVEHVSIPVKGKKTAMRKRTERSAWFRRLQRWRAGGEAKISWLKRKFGLRRTAVRGNGATAMWVGWGMIAHNLVQLSRLGP
jgi:IS5 family transposase